MQTLTCRAPLALVLSLFPGSSHVFQPGINRVWILIFLSYTFPQCCLCVMLSDTHPWHWGPADLQGWPSSSQILSWTSAPSENGTTLLTWTEGKTHISSLVMGSQDLTQKYFKQAAFSPNLPHLRVKLMSLGVQQSHLCISFFPAVLDESCWETEEVLWWAEGQDIVTFSAVFSLHFLIIPHSYQLFGRG